jgi:hypothetical protein
MNNFYTYYVGFVLILVTLYSIFCILSDMLRRELFTNLIAMFLFVPALLTSFDAFDYAAGPANHERVRVLLADHYDVPLDDFELTSATCLEGTFSCTLWAATFYFPGYSGVAEFNDTGIWKREQVHYRRGVLGELLILVEHNLQAIVWFTYLVAAFLSTPILLKSTFRKLKLLLSR